MRFSAGEKAIYAVSTTASAMHVVGEIVEVVAVGPFSKDEIVIICGKMSRMTIACDYVLDVGESYRFLLAMDWQLRKIDPPVDPIMITRNEQEEIEA